MKFFAVLGAVSLVGERKFRTRGERTLSATMGPLVARVSAAMTTPSSNKHPTIVVPVLVALGRGRPFACRAALRL